MRRSGRAAWRRAAAAAWATAALLLGCSAGPAGPAATPATETATLEASARLWNHDELTRTVQLFTTNSGEQPVTVTSVRLRSPRFEAVPARAMSARFAPGQQIDLVTPYGDAVCDATAGPDRAELVVDVGDGPRTVVIDLSAPHGVLARLHAEDCRAAELRDVVDVRFDPRWRPGADPDVVLGTLVLQRRRAGAPVTVAEVGGSVLVTVRSVDPLPAGGLVLAADQDRLDVPVLMRPARCDLHALAEAKKRWFLGAWLHLPGDEPLRLTVVPDEAAQTRLDAFLNRACDVPL